LAITILTNGVYSGTLIGCMARMLGFSFEHLAATKDTRLFFYEADFSVSKHIIDFHGRLVAVFAGAFDKNLVDEML
jgi:hypothetical protein